MKNSRFLVLALVVSLLASLTPAYAQDTAPAGPVKVQQPPLTFDFPGGTIAQLVTLLARVPGGPVNIIGEPEDLKTELPAFSMRNAHPAAVTQALGSLLQSRGLTLAHTGIRMSDSNDVYTLRRIPMPMSRSASRDQFESMQLGPYLEHQKIDDIIGAIRAAWELDPAHDAHALRLKYHPPTTILLVSGPTDATEIATKIVGTLRRSAEKPESERERAERLRAVANEVDNRRQQREAGTPNPTPPPTKR